MNIVVLGPGAIGSLWAYHLTRAGHKVSLWSRTEADMLSLTLDSAQPLSFENNQPQRLKSADLLLVCVKAWQVKQAIGDIASDLAPETIVVLMHNGMGAAEGLSLPSNPILLATTTHGAYKTFPTQVQHTGRGSTQIGPFNRLGQQCHFIAEVFDHALPETIWNPDIETALWQKLVINCAINPLTAIHKVKNGDLADARFAPIIFAIIDEIVLVSKACGVSMIREDLITRVYQVIEATSENYSSMHQDVVNTRPSEIDYITGYVLKKAEQLNIAVPQNQALYKEMKNIEHNWTSKYE